MERSSGGDTVAAVGDDVGGGKVLVVGVTMDSRGRELLAWALLKAAKSGDHVIALHILDPDAGEIFQALITNKSTLLSIVRNYDPELAAYEGFCNRTQVELKLKICKGSPVRKILCQQATLCGATSLILGMSKVHKIASRISIAKYCAKHLQKNTVVICVDNGKIVFQREPSASDAMLLASLDALEPKLKGRKTLPQSPLRKTIPRSPLRKTLPRSPLSLPSLKLSPSLGHRNENNSLALVPVTTKRPTKFKAGWARFRKMLSLGRKAAETSSAKKSSPVERIFNLPTRKPVDTISPDHKQILSSDMDDYHLDSNTEKGAIVLYSVDTKSVPFSAKIFSEELKDLGDKYSAKCQLFSYEELMLATKNFTPENLIGKGGSSQVYRGFVPGGKELAVKVLKPSKNVLNDFVSEIEILSSLHHKNIISLVGFCCEEDKLFLVYNLLSRGSLEENLHGTLKSENVFGWEERCKVALGVVEALDYLHNLDEPVIHRDLKSSNILLSDNFEAQLSDFGLATWASSSSLHVGDIDVAGTFGYFAPEYLMQEVNAKIDVYAFGVVLLELLSGRKPIDNDLPKGKKSLVMWARLMLKERKLSAMQDPSLFNACNSDQFEMMVLTAALCIRHSPLSRPEISLVRKLLQGDPEVIGWARQELETSEDLSVIGGEQSLTNIQSYMKLAMLNVDDDLASISSTEQNISVEDYIEEGR